MPSGRTSLAFKWPTDRHDRWTDEAVAALVGQSAQVRFMGAQVHGTITHANQYDDQVDWTDKSRPYIWVVMDIDLPAEDD